MQRHRPRKSAFECLFFLCGARPFFRQGKKILTTLLCKPALKTTLTISQLQMTIKRRHREEKNFSPTIHTHNALHRFHANKYLELICPLLFFSRIKPWMTCCMSIFPCSFRGWIFPMMGTKIFFPLIS